MGCPESWEALVSAYLDGEVTPDERDRVERHLADCASCARLRSELESDRALFVSLLGRAAAATPRPAAMPLRERRARKRVAHVPTPRRYRVFYLLAGIVTGLALGLLVSWDSVAGKPTVGRVASIEGRAEWRTSHGQAHGVAVGEEIRGSGSTRAAELPLVGTKTTDLVTGEGSGVAIALDKGGELRLGASTTVDLVSRAHLSLREGRVEFARESAGGVSPSIHAAGATVELRSGRVLVEKTGDAVRVVLFRGEVDLRASGAETHLVSLQGKPREVRVGADGEVVLVAPVGPEG
jgi:ferric-dicitrate binding protein FerR (iron transport regulator)